MALMMLAPILSSSELRLHDTTRCELVQRSRLYAPECDAVGDGPPWHVLVSGTGRSGTSFLSALLQKLGVHMLHDTYHRGINLSLDAGAVSWPQTFEPRAFSPACDYPWWTWRRRRLANQPARPGHSHRRFRRVFHLVRNPLKTIQSRANGAEAFASEGCFTDTHGRVTEIPNEKRHAVYALRHWVLHNAFAEAVAERRWRLESLKPEDVQDLIVAAGYNASSADSSSTHLSLADITAAMRAMGTSTNSNHIPVKDTSITWELMRALDRSYAIQAAVMALRYGYEEVLPNEIAAEARQYAQSCGFTKGTSAIWWCTLEKLDRVAEPAPTTVSATHMLRADASCDEDVAHADRRRLDSGLARPVGNLLDCRSGDDSRFAGLRGCNGPNAFFPPTWVNTPHDALVFYSHHSGKEIRVIGSSGGVCSPPRSGDLGPVLSLADVKAVPGLEGARHVASPQVVADPANQRLVLYVHIGGAGFAFQHTAGGGHRRCAQPTIVAVASAARPLHFHVLSNATIGCFYLRVVHAQALASHAHEYALWKRNQDGVVVARRPRGSAPDVPFEGSQHLVLPGARHASALEIQGQLYIAWSNVGECPPHGCNRSATYAPGGTEKILVARVRGTEWPAWELDHVHVLLAESNAEGTEVASASAPSGIGPARPDEVGLRDPDLVLDRHGRPFLLHTVGGESGLSAAQLVVRNTG